MSALTPQRDERGRLLPGVSLNPGGRPKGIEAVRALLSAHAPTFVAALVDLLKSKNESTRLAAVREYMDRFCGRPEQATEANIRTLDMGQLYLAAARQVNDAPPPSNVVVDVTPSPNQPVTDSENPTTADGEW